MHFGAWDSWLVLSPNLLPHQLSWKHFRYCQLINFLKFKHIFQTYQNEIKELKGISKCSFACRNVLYILASNFRTDEHYCVPLCMNSKYRNTFISIYKEMSCHMGKNINCRFLFLWTSDDEKVYVLSSTIDHIGE